MVGVVPKPANDNVMLAIALMLGAYLLFSFIDTGAKYLALLGIPSLQLAFMRYFGAFVISMAIIGRGGVTRDRFGTEKVFLVLLRGMLLMLSTVLNFFALRYLPLTLTSTILFSSPIIICALSWPLLGERVGFWRWAAIMVGFCGIVVAIRPFDDSFHWAVFLSLAAAFCFALYSILTRKLAGVVATDTMQFYAGLIGTLVLLPFAILDWVAPSTSWHWMILIGLGFFGWAGHQLLTVAHANAPASTLTPFGYAFILYLTVWSYLVFDHLPDRWTLLGAAIIIAAGLVIWLRERNHVRARAVA